MLVGQLGGEVWRIFLPAPAKKRGAECSPYVRLLPTT